VADLAHLLTDPISVVIDEGEQLAGAGESCALIEDLLSFPGPGLRVSLLTRSSLGLRLARPRPLAS
jgi:hypothetical protein